MTMTNKRLLVAGLETHYNRLEFSACWNAILLEEYGFMLNVCMSEVTGIHPDATLLKKYFFFRKSPSCLIYTPIHSMPEIMT